jgi:hypothetical protein
MDDRLRISDADREHAAERLREHFADGRLTSDELDDRLAAVFSARTAGDLRRVRADLPGPAPAGHAPPGPGAPGAGSRWPGARWPGRPRAAAAYGRRGVAFRRRPRILPLVLVALLLAVLIPGAFAVAFKAVLLVVLVSWLLLCVGGAIAALRFRRHVRRFWRSGGGGAGWQQHWQQYQDQWRR